MRLIITRGGHQEELLLESDDEYATALRDYFGIDLGGSSFRTIHPPAGAGG
jgi:hypothetical protein